MTVNGDAAALTSAPIGTFPSNAPAGVKLLAAVDVGDYGVPEDRDSGDF